ncbi:LPP20 family lipoprotein [Sulfurimonas sp. SAG-AH-194-C21]|nr:LPP20 family lipoprotein [Sulfurimonas sp. SAG-AH-194-C21]MDF1882358.1 LPP20 family lipoprotein [Sulfurimonas sp. SAG-AH-194-C21]
MKKLLLSVLFVPLLALASPEWMFKIEHEKTQIIGYGVGSTLREAKQSAMYDIINFISVNIKSKMAISSSDVNGKASNSSSANLSTSSQAQLSGVEFIKITQEGNLWYVGAVYDNSPFEVKFERLIGPQTKDEVQNTYLKKTTLICTLNNEMQASLNYSIIRQNNLWQLKYDKYLLALKQEDFYKLFSTQHSKSIHLSANKEVYKEKDEMYFNIQHKTPGFISILYVEHNGKVGVLLENYPSQHNFKYPDIKDEDMFKVSNPYKKTIYELYVAIYSKSSLNLQEFENIGDSYLDESSYNFDKLIKFLDKKSFSTYTIKIK